ncbi:MAG TPA: VOC family protein [Patescibacteria group bacterium]|nr:VOC family protein [Patescibacteria group bacterium]
MKSFVYHFQINVADKNISFPFYKELLGYLDYEVMFEDEKVLGLGNGNTDLWLVQTDKKFVGNKFHRKNTGVNHISFGLESKENVDKFVNEFLKPKGVKFLYETPKEFPEYGKGYYAVYFEDPDRIKLEVTYKPEFKDK